MRAFALADLDRILAIEQASFSEEAWDAQIFRDCFRQCPRLFFVATRWRRIAGYSITCAQAKSAELVSIAVDPTTRNRGVGRALLEQTEARLRSRGIGTWWLMVSVDNTAAIRFYEQYGFECVRLEKRYYGRGRDAWRMRLGLTATAADRRTGQPIAPSRNANTER